MTIPVESQTPSYHFDDRTIQWRELGDFKHFVVSIFSVDEEKNIADFIVKFEPNQQIFLHRHLALTNTFVVDGEHIIYEANGKVREVRPVGRYTSSPAGDAHREGGGANGCVLQYSVRGETDALFDVLDDDLQVLATLRTQDFKAALNAQRQA
jgi:quercetin dioxygenase-like cupin family protein